MFFKVGERWKKSVIRERNIGTQNTQIHIRPDFSFLTKHWARVIFKYEN